MRSTTFAVGVDADFAAIRRHRSFVHRCVADISALPFAGGRFDLVTANMVVEHLDDPIAQFTDVARVLAPNGLFLFHTPNAQSYITMLARPFPDAVKRVAARFLEGRDAVDVYPTYYRANRATDIQRIARTSGFEIEQIEYVNSSPTFNMFPPLLLPELLILRQLQRRQGLTKYRAALIGVLRRTA
jgi:SAM-dependent methyltransferase